MNIKELNEALAKVLNEEHLYEYIYDCVDDRLDMNEPIEEIAYYCLSKKKSYPYEPSLVLSEVAIGVLQSRANKWFKENPGKSSVDDALYDKWCDEVWGIINPIKDRVENADKLLKKVKRAIKKNEELEGLTVTELEQLLPRIEQVKDYGKCDTMWLYKNQIDFLKKYGLYITD